MPMPLIKITKNMNNQAQLERCRLCGLRTQQDDLIAPCNCTGDRLKVHFRCLHHRMVVTGNTKRCPTCNTNYRNLYIEPSWSLMYRFAKLSMNRIKDLLLFVVLRLL